MLVYGVLLQGVHISKCKSTGFSFNNAKSMSNLRQTTRTGWSIFMVTVGAVGMC